MKASVIIPVKNGGKLLKKVLEKVLTQEFDDFEVIVIDSGSKDNSIEDIKFLQKKYENLILKEILPKDFGHGKTRNYGASIASGEFIVFITQDALPYDDNWLNEMIKPFEISNDIVGVFAKHLPYEDCDIFEKENLNIHFNNFGQGIVLYKIEDKKRYEIDEGYRHLLCFYSDNASAMRKDIWRKIPYEDVNFAEDQLWAKKIIELGYTKAYNSNAVVYHSHNYKFKEMLKRSYDDHKGLYEIYKYVPVRNVFLLPLYILNATYKDLKFLLKKDLSKVKKIKWFIYSISKNIAKYTGAYLGPKKLSYSLGNLFSREHILRNK
jgi:rhamnosyltransferase